MTAGQAHSHREMEVTPLLIPGHNGSDAELQAMSAWFTGRLGPEVPWYFSAFHPDWKMRDVPATPFATLQHARHREAARSPVRLHG